MQIKSFLILVTVNNESVLRCPTNWTRTVWGIALQKRTWRALLDTKLNTSHQCTLAEMMANHVLACISKGIGSRLGEGIIVLPYSLVNPNLG